LLAGKASLGKAGTAVDLGVKLCGFRGRDFLRAARAFEAFNVVRLQFELNGFCRVNDLGASSARRTTTSELGFDGLGACRCGRRWL